MSEVPLYPHEWLRGFRSPEILGWYVTKFAPHKALDLIACVKLAFDERDAVHRVVAGGSINLGEESSSGHDFICKCLQSMDLVSIKITTRLL